MCAGTDSVKTNILCMFTFSQHLGERIFHFGRVCVQVLIRFSLIFYVCSLSASTSQAAVEEVEEDDEVKETQDEDEGDEAEGRLFVHDICVSSGHLKKIANCINS